MPETSGLNFNLKTCSLEIIGPSGENLYELHPTNISCVSSSLITHSTMTSLLEVPVMTSSPEVPTILLYPNASHSSTVFPLHEILTPKGLS